MTSLLTDSLDFLSNQIEIGLSDPERASRTIAERAVQLRAYARGIVINETLNFDEETVECGEGADTSCVQGEQGPQEEYFYSPSIAWAAAKSDISRSQLPPIPQIPGVDPDAMKNILMSWFYAGYYTAKAECSTKLHAR